MENLKVNYLPMKNDYKVDKKMKMLHQKLNIIKKEEKEKKFYMWLNQINDDGISNQDIINNMIKDILNSISKNYEFDNLKLFKDQIASYIYYNSIKNAIY